MGAHEPGLGPAVRVARGASVLFSQSVVNLILGVGYFALLTRLVPPREMGLLTVLMLVLYLADLVGDLGLSGASSKYIPDFLSRDDFDGASSVYRAILRTNVLCGLSLSAVCFTLAPWISSALTQSPVHADLFRLMSLSVFTGTLTYAFSGFVQGLQRMKELAGIGLANSIVRRFLGILLLYVGYGLFGVLYGWILGDLTAVLLSVLVVSRRLRGASSVFPLGTLLGFSIPILGYNLLNYALQWVDRAFIMTYLSLSDLGIYQVAFYAFGVLGVIPSSIFTALYPQLSELYGRHGDRAITRVFKTTTRYIALICTPVVLMTIALHRPLIVLFAGPSYVGASVPLAVMSLGALAWGFFIVITSFLMSLGKTRAILGVSTASFALYIAACPLLVPCLSLIGAAIARGSLPFAMLVMGAYVLAKYLPIEFDVEACWKAFVSGVISSLIVTLIMRTSSTYLLLVAYCGVYVAVYISALTALRAIHRSDVDLFERFAPKPTKRLVKHARKLAW